MAHEGPRTSVLVERERDRRHHDHDGARSRVREGQGVNEGRLARTGRQDRQERGTERRCERRTDGFPLPRSEVRIVADPLQEGIAWRVRPEGTPHRLGKRCRGRIGGGVEPGCGPGLRGHPESRVDRRSEASMATPLCKVGPPLLRGNNERRMGGAVALDGPSQDVPDQDRAVCRAATVDGLDKTGKKRVHGPGWRVSSQN